MALDKLGGNSFSTGAIANSLGYTPVANTSAAVVTALGYTPVANTNAGIAGALGYGTAGKSQGYTAIPSGAGWLRIGNMSGRWSYRVGIGTTGGSLSPGFTYFVVHRGWGNDLYVGQVLKLNTQYATQVRANSTTADQDWKLEIYWNTSTQQSPFITIEPYGSPNDVGYTVDTTTGIVSSSLGYISGPTVL